MKHACKHPVFHIKNVELLIIMSLNMFCDIFFFHV